MKLPKTCFSTKITKVTLTKTVSLLALTLTTNMFITQTVHADNTYNFTKDTVTCATALVCKKLTEFIQTQIEELEAKGDLSTEDKKLRYNLKKQLITVEKLETKKNSNLIATENQKQKENSSLIDAINKTDAQISGLRGALLEK